MQKKGMKRQIMEVFVEFVYWAKNASKSHFCRFLCFSVVGRCNKS